ncbi:MAG: redoxin domain-containing protein [Erysipelotrichaceae bacterium]|nr:redoxin domain-containing protein [Erysipelotrichaceae bacterium]MDY5251553.1 cytochrome c biogenesis protein CcdA [Erysipelotrichaceae bacterium]
MDMSIVISMVIEGLLSFFSPCILPVLPLYFGYLASGAKSVDEQGNVTYSRLKVFITTCFFVTGVSFAILLLGISASVFNGFFSRYSLIISFIGAFLLIFFGLNTLGVIQVPALMSEKKLGAKVNLNEMNYLNALLFGFLFSFSWTPCIGPYLTSAIVLASTAGSIGLGVVYILCYILGFVIMFLLVGLFTEEMLNILNKKRHIMKYTTIVGGALMIVMGGYMFVNASQQVLNLQANTNNITQDQNQTAQEQTDMEKYGFTLKTNKGNTVTLSDIKDQHVVLTFFRTWCGYCKQEIADLKELQKQYPQIQFYLVTSPNMDRELDEAGIEKWLADNDIDIEVIYDENNQVHSMYGVQGFPSAFFFDDDQSVYGYVPGYVQHDQMVQILDDLLQ